MLRCALNHSYQIQAGFEVERSLQLAAAHKAWLSTRYGRLLIDGLLLVYLIYVYKLGGNWEAVITQDAVLCLSKGASVLVSVEHR